MRTILAICVLFLMGCASNKVMIIEGPPDALPIWTIENVPDNGEVSFERTKDGETVKVQVKNKDDGWNPLSPIMDIFSKIAAIALDKTDIQMDGN